MMALYVQKLDLYGAAVANLPYAQQDVHGGLNTYVFEVSVFQFIYTVIPLASYEYIYIYIYICAKCWGQHLIFEGPQYATCFMPLVWFLQLEGGF